MGKVFGIFGMVASAFLGHWMYGEFKASRCQDTVEDFRDAYKKQRGNPNRSDIAKVIKSAAKACEAGDPDLAYSILNARATMCRMSDDC